VSTTARQPDGPVPASRLARGGTPWVALGAIVLLAAALRFATLGTQSIWFDEAATWDVVRGSFGAMLDRLPDGESNPPLFYVLEWGWIRVFGDGEAGLRSLSALAGLLTVPVAYGIGRRVGGTRAGLAAAALVAVNPLLVWFSQEARSYALAVLLSALALLLFLHAREDPRGRLLAGWAVAAALALATHYFTAFVLLPQALLLLRDHPRRRSAAAAVGAVGATGLALLPLLLAQRGNPYEIASESIAVRLAQVPKQFLLGYRGPLALPLGLLGAALVAGGVWLLVRRADPDVRRRAGLVAAVGASGLLLPVLAALVGADYLNARNLLPALVPLLAALGAGYAARRAARAGAALLAGLCAASLAIVVAVAVDSEYQRADWRGLARALGTSDVPRALVIAPANGELALRYYRRALRPIGAEGVAVEEVDVVAVATSPNPGTAPEIPLRQGTTLAIGGFEEVPGKRTDTFELLRFPALGPAVVVGGTPLAVVRFGERPPALAVLPAGR
jgi:mannosyltransferase